MTTRSKIILGTSIAIIAIGTVLHLARITDRWPGGMNGNASSDPEVPKIAKTALPISAAIKKYFTAHAAYPPNLSVVQADLPADCPLTPGGYVNGWKYVPSPNGTSFSLIQKLGWDPSLEYLWDGSTETWTFHPGDGSPDKPIIPAP